MEAIYFILLGFIFIGLIIVCKKESRFLFWAAFLIPLNSVVFEWHVLFTFAKLIFIIAIINRLLHHGSSGQTGNSKESNISLYGWLIGFLFFGTILTLGWMILDPGSLLDSRAIARYAVQLSGFITLWGLAFVGLWFVKTSADLRAAINGFISGNLLNAFTGFYQIIALRFHLPWLKGFWIVRQADYLNPEIAREQWSYMVSGALPRLSGLGGEPKHAAANLIVALILLLSLYIFDKGFRISHIKIKISVLLLALALTFSVGSWVSFVVTLAYLAIQGLLARKAEAIKVMILVIAIGTGLGLFAGQRFIGDVRNKYVGYKLSSQSLEKYGDWKIFSYLIENPASLIFGHGSGGSDSLQPKSILVGPKRKLITTPRYCLTQIVFEQGIVGLMLVLTIAIIWATALFRAGFPAFGHFVLGGFLVTLVSHMTVLYGFLFLCGCMIASINKNTANQ